MKTPPRPANEQDRLDALAEYRILDTHPEQVYDDITHLASHICGVPMALISLVDENRQWLKSTVGVDISETSRDISFCGHCIMEEKPMVVPDTHQDNRFKDNPLVTGDPNLRFYAGVPLLTPDGHALGTLCVLDRTPKQLTKAQYQALETLARQVMAVMELRRVSSHLAKALENIRALHGLLPICSYCKKVRDDEGYWEQVDQYIREHSDLEFTHGICPECTQQYFPEVEEYKKRHPHSSPNEK